MVISCYNMHRSICYKKGNFKKGKLKTFCQSICFVTKGKIILQCEADIPNNKIHQQSEGVGMYLVSRSKGSLNSRLLPGIDLNRGYQTAGLQKLFYKILL